MKSVIEEADGANQHRKSCTVLQAISPDAANRQLGKYGLLCQTYLKEHRPDVYDAMRKAGMLWQYLANTDQTCNERMELFVRKMAQQEGVTEALKAASEMEWVRRMNSIHNRAEEIVLREVVYE